MKTVKILGLCSHITYIVYIATLTKLIIGPD